MNEYQETLQRVKDSPLRKLRASREVQTDAIASTENLDNAAQRDSFIGADFAGAKTDQ